MVNSYEDEQNKTKYTISKFVKENKQLLGIIHFIATYVAIYISTVCNETTNISHMLGPIIFPEGYLAYIFLTRGFRYNEYCNSKYTGYYSFYPEIPSKK